MNLPNAITMGRIAATPVIATLVINAAWLPRLSAWVLFIAAATTDYVDGKLAGTMPARSKRCLSRIKKPSIRQVWAKFASG